MTNPAPVAVAQLRSAFRRPEPSARMQAALAAGTHPNPGDIEVLIQRSADEPDFYVRDMVTWALTRHPAALTVPRLLQELGRESTQARSQALHTLSKIGDPVAWPAVTTALLHDADEEVARSAWRAAVVLVPNDRKAELAQDLSTQLGRDGREVQLSLSRALAALGDVARPAVVTAARSDDESVRRHALATQRLLDDPDTGFEAALHDARRIMALTDSPAGDGPDADR